MLGLPDMISACLFDLDGVRSFLAARGIDADEKLVPTLAGRKNDLVQAMVRTDGVEAYEGSVHYAEAPA